MNKKYDHVGWNLRFRKSASKKSYVILYNLAKTCASLFSQVLLPRFPFDNLHEHYNDVIMGVIASQFTSLTIVFLTVYLDTDQRKHQSSASLTFVRGIHRRPVNSPHKWPVTRKMFPFDDVIMNSSVQSLDDKRVTFWCQASCMFDTRLDHNDDIARTLRQQIIAVIS